MQSGTSSVVPSFTRSSKTRISAPIWSVSSRLGSPRNDVQHYLLVSGSAFWEVRLDRKKLNNDYTFILSCLPHYSAFSSVGACVNKVCSIIIRLARHTRPTRYSWTSYYCCTAVVHMLHWLRSHRQPNQTLHFYSCHHIRGHIESHLYGWGPQCIGVFYLNQSVFYSHQYFTKSLETESAICLVCESQQRDEKDEPPVNPLGYKDFVLARSSLPPPFLPRSWPPPSS